MEKLLLNAQMREADAYTINTVGISSQTLMRRAGHKIADEVIKVVKEKNFNNILVVCGTGNNGGDGYVCAQILNELNYNVKVFAINGRFSEDCLREKSAYTGVYSEKIEGQVIVDCIFGTGLTREVIGDYLEIINRINKSGAYVISADLPSGLNGDNGQMLGCAVNADLTVAIAEYKTGMFLGDGLDCCGKIVKKDIGITCPDCNYINIYSDDDIKPFYPKRKRNSHKGTYGSANIIAGSDKYIGAAALAAEAALMSGCGFVKLTTSEKVKLALAASLPQVIFSEQDLSSQSIALGMGCGVSAELYNLIGYILTNYNGTLIIDADGLNTLARYGTDILNKKTCRVILTPHIKEFSRLTKNSIEEILNDPITLARNFSQKYDVTLVLKSAVSIICEKDRMVFNAKGSTALSKGGSGDILSGYMCGCAARGLNAFDAAVCATYTLGSSAEISSEDKTDYCATFKDIIKNLHFAVKRLTV